MHWYTPPRIMFLNPYITVGPWASQGRHPHAAWSGSQDPPVLWPSSRSVFSPEQGRSRWDESPRNTFQLAVYIMLVLHRWTRWKTVFGVVFKRVGAADPPPRQSWTMMLLIPLEPWVPTMAICSAFSCKSHFRVGWRDWRSITRWAYYARKVHSLKKHLK